MEPKPLALGVQSLSHWTSREVPTLLGSKDVDCLVACPLGCVRMSPRQTWQHLTPDGYVRSPGASQAAHPLPHSPSITTGSFSVIFPGSTLRRESGKWGPGMGNVVDPRNTGKCGLDPPKGEGSSDVSKGSGSREQVFMAQG